MNLKQKYNENIKSELITELNISNVMTVPSLEKIVLNRGIGQVTSNSKILEETFVEMLNITGQKPVLTKAKKSISNFKLRKDMHIGCKVTVRGDKMWDFLNKFLNISVPKIRDFRGLPKNSFDKFGNYTLGIKDNNIFPEINQDKIMSVKGYDLTFVIKNSSPDASRLLLKKLGLLFRD